MSKHLSLFVCAVVCGLSVLTYAQVGNIVGGRGGELYTTTFLLAPTNGVSPAFDTTGLPNIPPQWRSQALAIVIGDTPVNGAALRGYTDLDNKTGYSQRFEFYLASEAMVDETFCSIAVGKAISPLEFNDGSVPIAYYIKITKTGGLRKFQIDIPTESGSLTTTWSGTVGLQTVYRLTNDYNIRTAHHRFTVNSDTVLDRDFDGSAVQSIGTVVLGSSGGSTCRNVVYLIGRVLESPVAPTPYVVAVLPSAPVISGNSPANGATAIPIVGQSLGCSSTNAVSHKILFGTVNPPVTEVTLPNSGQCGYPLATLTNATTYYWQAKPSNAAGVTTGAVWSFATVAAPSNGDLDLIAAKANCVDSGDNSPTGRNPNLLWTCARQAVWNQTVDDYEAAGCSSLSTAGTCSATPATLAGRWFKQARAICLLGAAGAQGANYGQWCALMYQMTGDVGYVTNATFGAWKTITTRYINGTIQADPNVSRLVQSMHTIMLDWMRPALTDAQFLQYVGEIDLENDQGWWVYGGGTGRSTDPDQAIGQWYFPPALMKVILPNNVSNNAIWDDVNMGGFDAEACSTTPPPANLRDGICHMFTVMGAGGEYLEGPMYAKETLPWIGVMAQAVSDARGVDTYPEITTWLASAATQQSFTFTPDLQKQVQWADEQDPNILIKGRVGEVLMALAGLLQGTAAGNKTQQLLADMVTAHGETIIGPYYKWWGYMVFNPNASVADWKTPKSLTASGMGTQFLKSGFTSSDSLFFNHCDPYHFYTGSYGTYSFDHRIVHGCTPKLYKNGEWISDFIGSYAGASNSGEGNNVMRYQGFGNVREYAQVRSQSLADTHAFMSYVMGGAKVNVEWSGLGKPPVYLNEGSRATLHVPGAISTIIIHDRASVDDIVNDNTDMLRYPLDCGENGRNFITQQHAKQEWLWHIPVAPTVAGGVYTWTTPITSQSAKLTSLLPAVATRTVYDLATTFAQNLSSGHRCHWHNTQILAGAPHYYTVDGGGYDRKLLKIWPTTMGTFHTYLAVFQVGASTPATPTLITNNNAECAHVVTTGQNDVLACFNGTTSTVLSNTPYDITHKAILDSARLWNAVTYTAAVTTVAGNLELHLADLKPTLTWTYNVDGAGAVTINGAGLTTTGGYARIVLALTPGAHLIVVTGS